MIKIFRSFFIGVSATIFGIFIFCQIESMFFTQTSVESPIHDRIIKKENINVRSPIGDNTHTEVYSFIKMFLLNSHSWQSVDIRKLRDKEINLKKNKDNKAFDSHIKESEISGLLRILNYISRCEYITLYLKDGVGIATSKLVDSPNYSVLMSPRKIDFEIGILGQDILKEPKMYTYETHDGRIAYEFLKAVYYYKDDKEDYAYLGFMKKRAKDILIGYVSYMVTVDK